jgi:hypothetical protein
MYAVFVWDAGLDLAQEVGPELRLRPRGPQLWSL